MFKERDERLYRALWRLHFYAGLFCIPFILWLAVTGSIYVLKPQIDALIDRPYDQLRIAGPPENAWAQVNAALAAVPGSRLNAYELAQTPHSAVRVLVGRGSEVIRVYVQPQTLRILKIIPENARFENVVDHLHGELLMGDRGSNIVELAASWAIVMILTGFYLWWPRGVRGAGGVLYPRFGPGRMFWRDLHSVTGVWVSLFALFFLFSGLPWATSWGAMLTGLQAAAARATLHHDWTAGSGSERARDAARNAPAAMAGMPDMTGMAGMAMTSDTAPGNLDAMVADVSRLHLAPPVLISPPSAASPNWTARSDAQDRPLRVTDVLDPVTGAVVRSKGFGAQRFLDKVVAVAVAAHEGQLFAPINQALNLSVAAALILVVISAAVMWWSRRPKRVLGAPRPLKSPRYSAALIAAVVLLGLILPFFGLSLLIVLVLERTLLRRISPLREFLGLAVRA